MIQCIFKHWIFTRTTHLFSCTAEPKAHKTLK